MVEEREEGSILVVRECLEGEVLLLEVFIEGGAHGILVIFVSQLVDYSDGALGQTVLAALQALLTEVLVDLAEDILLFSRIHPGLGESLDKVFHVLDTPA